MPADKQEELRQRMSERLSRELESARREVERALARIHGTEKGAATYGERQFSGVTDAERAELERDRRELAGLERRSLETAIPPRKRRSLALRMYAWKKRNGR